MEWPKDMLAAVLVEQRQPLMLARVLLPRELRYGQVLVQVLCSGICGSQIGEVDGVKGPDAHLPHLLGHEGCGKVLAVGDGVRHVRPGDRVVLHWMPGEGAQAEPPVYSWNGKPLHAGWVTTFNEYAVVSANRLTAVPADFDPETAALFGCAVTTGLGVVNNKAEIRIGESVLVLGAGGVGLNIIQGAAMVAAHPVIAVDLHEAKLALARKMGATHVLNARNQDLDRSVREITGPRGVDAAIDNTGAPEMIELAYALTAAEGRTILVGVLPKDKRVSLQTLPLHFGKTLTGTKGGECRPQDDIPRYVRLVREGKLKLDALITERSRLEDVNNVMDRMRRGEIAGRCLIRIAGAERSVT